MTAAPAKKLPRGRRLLLLGGLAVLAFVWLRRGQASNTAADATGADSGLPAATDGSLAGTAAGDVAAAQSDQLQSVLDQLGQISAAVVAADQDTQAGLSQLGDVLSANAANEQAALEDLASSFAMAPPGDVLGTGLQPGATGVVNSTFAPMTRGASGQAPFAAPGNAKAIATGVFAKPITIPPLRRGKTTPRATLTPIRRFAQPAFRNLTAGAPRAAATGTVLASRLVANAPAAAPVGRTLFSNLTANLGRGGIL